MTLKRFMRWLQSLWSSRPKPARPLLPKPILPQPYPVRLYRCKALLVWEGQLYVVKAALLTITIDTKDYKTKQFFFHDATVLAGVTPKPDDRLLYVDAILDISKGSYPFHLHDFGHIDGVYDFMATMVGPVFITHLSPKDPAHAMIDKKSGKTYGYYTTDQAQASSLLRDPQEVVNNTEPFTPTDVMDSNDRYVETRLILE